MDFFRSHLRFFTLSLCFAVFVIIFLTVLRFFFSSEFSALKELFLEYFGAKIDLSLVFLGEQS